MDGDVLDPDYYLGLYDDWRDASTWPVSSRESEAVQRSAKQQAAAEEFDEGDPDAWKKRLQYEKRSMEIKGKVRQAGDAASEAVKHDGHMPEKWKEKRNNPR